MPIADIQSGPPGGPSQNQDNLPFSALLGGSMKGDMKEGESAKEGTKDRQNESARQMRGAGLACGIFVSSSCTQLKCKSSSISKEITRVVKKRSSLGTALHQRERSLGRIYTAPRFSPSDILLLAVGAGLPDILRIFPRKNHDGTVGRWCVLCMLSFAFAFTCGVVNSATR